MVKCGLQRMVITLLTRELLEKCLDFHVCDSFVIKHWVMYDKLWQILQSNKLYSGYSTLNVTSLSVVKTIYPVAHPMPGYCLYENIWYESRHYGKYAE